MANKNLAEKQNTTKFSHEMIEGDKIKEISLNSSGTY